MPLTAKSDFVFSPKSTVILNGITNCAVLGTSRAIYLIPIQNMSGAGSTVTTSKTSIGGADPISGIQAILNDPSQSIESLEKWAESLIKKDLGLSEDYIIVVDQLSEFNIKMGFFSKGIYYKRGESRRQAIAGVPKAILQEFKEFYGV